MKGGAMTRPRTAIIVGGGIAGPVAAMALTQAGIDATVHEAHPGGSEGIGGFLTLASNGIDALRAIDADKRALGAGFATPGITLRSTTGKKLGLARIGLALPDGTTSQTLKRTDLYKAIYDEAISRGITIEHGKRLVNVKPGSDGLQALFDDGTEAHGEVLVGADGVHSVVRQLVDPTALAPTYEGLLSLGGYTSGVETDTEPGSYTMIFGKRAFFGYVQAPKGDVWWFANVPRADEPPRGQVEAITAEEWRARLVELFADDAGPAIRLVQATDTADIQRATPLHSVPHLRVWHTDQMVVIGDAAHAPTPTSGQGASLSIEDAVVVAKCLRDLPDAQLAFSRFEDLRRRRVERIIKQAARINSNKAPGPTARVLRDAVLPLVMKRAANGNRAMEPYRYHIDWRMPIGSAG
jgi:2-polyprenyl-6-methoxyphenol hydroxylase-like FAD-dependent oxidoreductase